MTIGEVHYPEDLTISYIASVHIYSIPLLSRVQFQTPEQV
jgi:hypothetical protein